MTEIYIPPILVGGKLVETQRSLQAAMQALEQARQAITTNESSIGSNDTDIAALQSRLDELDRFRSYGRALRFDGVNDYAKAGSGDGDIGSGGAVIDLLLRLGGETASNHQVYMIKRSGIGSGALPGLSVRHNKAAGIGVIGKFFVEVHDGTSYAIAGYDYDLDAAPRDRVHRITAHIDRTSSLLRFFFDGVAGETASISSVGSIVDAAQELIFGATSANTLNADMDLVWASIRFGDYTAEQILSEGMDLPEVSSGGDLWWNFNDGTGSSVTAYPETRRDYLIFDGTNDQVSIADSSSISPGDISVEMLLRYTTNTGFRRLYDKSSSYVADINNGDLRAYANDTSAVLHGPINPADPDQYAVFHHTFTYDAASDTARVYIDGVEVAEDTSFMGGTGGVNDSTSSLYWFSRAADRFLGGTLFFARIWDHARSASQVAEDMITLDRSAETGLALQHKVDEATGSSLGDSSANSNSGTITGATWGSNNLAITGATWVDDGENWYLMMREGY